MSSCVLPAPRVSASPVAPKSKGGFQRKLNKLTARIYLLQELVQKLETRIRIQDEIIQKLRAQRKTAWRKS